MYQTSLLARMEPEEALEPFVVLHGDPRWQPLIKQLPFVRYIVADTEFYFDKDFGRNFDVLEGHLRLLQIGIPSGEVLIFDYGSVVDDRERRFEMYRRDGSEEAVRRALEDRKIPVVGMALHTEYLGLRQQLGIKMRCMRDIMLMSQVLWAGVGAQAGADIYPSGQFFVQQPLKHSMAAIAARCGLPVVDKTEQASDWGGRLTNKQLNYAARDVIIPAKVWFILGRMLKEDNLLVSTIGECEAQPAFCEFMYNGLPVDEPLLRDTIEKWNIVREEVLTPFRKRFPNTNPNSPQEVAEVLAEALDSRFCPECKALYEQKDGWVPETCDYCVNHPPLQRRHHVSFTEVKQNKKGKDYKASSTADTDLVEYRSAPYVSALLQWKSMTTCVSWLNGVLSNVRDGRIRGKFKQIASGGDDGDSSAGRGMGRSSCGKPVNLQNPANQASARGEKLGAPPIRVSIRPHAPDLPQRLNLLADRVENHNDREYLLATADHIDKLYRGRKRVMIVADLSQAHMRIAAQASQDPVLLRDFRAGNDNHLAMAHKLLIQAGYNISYEEAAKARADKKHPLHSVVKGTRNTAKPVNYGKLNLGGAETLKRTAETSAEPVFFTLEEAETAANIWSELYSVLSTYQRDKIKAANRHWHTFEHIGVRGVYGEVRALTGRRLFLQKRFRTTKKGSTYWSVKGTDCVSAVWMMTEADIIKHAAAEVLKQSDAHPEWDNIMANMAHDELDTECWEDYGAVVAEMTMQAFQDAMRWGGVVDLPVDEAGANSKSMIKESWASK